MASFVGCAEEVVVEVVEVVVVEEVEVVAGREVEEEEELEEEEEDIGQCHCSRCCSYRSYHNDDGVRGWGVRLTAVSLNCVRVEVHVRWSQRHFSSIPKK